MPPIANNPKYLKITVQNRGTSPTTITNISFHTYNCRWNRTRYRKPTFSAALKYYEGQPFPRPLEVGGEWGILMRQDERFDELLSKNGDLWVAVTHSFAKRPTQAKIFQLPK